MCYALSYNFQIHSRQFKIYDVFISKTSDVQFILLGSHHAMPSPHVKSKPKPKPDLSSVPKYILVSKHQLLFYSE